MPLSSIYMVKFRQTWGSGGKPLENVFFYDHTAGTGLAGDLATAFLTSIGNAINELQNNVVKNIGVDVINMGVPTDFIFTAFSGTGVGTGETLPPVSAIAYTLKTNTRLVKKGSKRISGVPESAQNNGVILDAAYLANIELLRIALQQELVSAEDTWLPVVLKRVRTPVAGTVPQQYRYRLPATDSELVVGEVAVVLTTDKVKHQVSRQI